MVTLLVILSLVGWVVGALLLTQATYGVGVLAAACLFGILARIAQANEHHRELMRLMRAGLGMTGPPSASAGAWMCPGCQQFNSSTLFDCIHCGAGRPRG